jgi:hypothetical protein
MQDEVLISRLIIFPLKVGTVQVFGNNHNESTTITNQNAIQEEIKNYSRRSIMIYRHHQI